MVLTQGDPAQLFQVKCAICHTIGGGRLVGPDLLGVQERRSEEWLLKFIHSSQSMIKSGDPEAKLLFEEYGQMVMPDPMLSDNEIRSILQYIRDQAEAGGSVAAYESILGETGPADIELGRRLFDGRESLANGAPSCIACHNGLSQTFFNERSFARDLQASFATLGEQGVRSILENPPFPVMAEAFRDRPLEPGETRALMAFLQNSGVARNGETTSAPASGFLMYGLLGAGTLLLIYSALWQNRKSSSVNRNIYKRQIKSIN